MNVEQRVIYKAYSRDGTYLGLLPNPSEPFNYSQDINTGAAEMILHIPQNIDNADQDPDVLTDEAGALLTDEQGALLTIDRATDIVGISGSGALIANDNDVQAWGFNDDNPNGVLLFAGFISRWRGIIGTLNDIEVTVTSYGKDLVDYIFGNSAFSAQITQTTVQAPPNDTDAIFFGSGTANEEVAQTFTPGSSFDITKITAKIAVTGPPIFPADPGPFTVTCGVYSGTPNGSNTLLGSISVLVSNLFDLTIGSYLNVEFIPSTAIPVTNGGAYFFKLTGSGSGVWNWNSSGSVYAGGTVWKKSSGVWSDTGNDSVFTVYAGSLLTDASFNATDPSDMIRDALDGYQAQGGVVTYTAQSIEDTGLSWDYDFKLATVAEIIAKARELAPSNWYWYVDPATNVLYFKELV